MNPQFARGRRIVSFIIAFTVIAGLSAIILAIAKERYDSLPKLGIRFAVKLYACYCLWTGSRWVRWLYVIGFMLAAAGCLFAAFRLGQLLPWPIFATVGCLFGWSGWLLGFSPSVNAFFVYQRTGLPLGAMLDLESESSEEQPEAVPQCQECGMPQVAGLAFCNGCGSRIA